jgi:hypothetical protein
MWMVFAAMLLMLDPSAETTESPKLEDFMAFCKTRSPECIVAVADDLGRMQDSYCGPKPFDGMADARRVYAYISIISRIRKTASLHATEADAVKQIWPCKKP